MLKNSISRDPFPDKIVYRFELRIWLYLVEPPFSLELMPLFFILIASPIPHRQESVPSFLVLIIPFWFHSTMEIAYLHLYDGVPLGEL